MGGKADEVEKKRVGGERGSQTARKKVVLQNMFLYSFENKVLLAALPKITTCPGRLGNEQVNTVKLLAGRELMDNKTD